jgi:hypothetical protein
MAQTRKRRRRKHRGTQAGTLGKRRSRPRSRSEAKAQARSRASSKKRPSRGQRVAERVGAAPTWRGAVNRALIAAGIFLLLLVFLFGRPFMEGFALSAFMLVVYIPMGYYFDRFVYRWRLRREEKERLARKADKEKAKA